MAVFATFHFTWNLSCTVLKEELDVVGTCGGSTTLFELDLSVCREQLGSGKVTQREKRILATLSKRRFWQRGRKPEVNLTFLTKHGAYFSLHGVRVVENVACLRSLLAQRNRSITQWRDSTFAAVRLRTPLNAAARYFSTAAIHTPAASSIARMRKTLHRIVTAVSETCWCKHVFLIPRNLSFCLALREFSVWFHVVLSRSFVRLSRGGGGV